MTEVGTVYGQALYDLALSEGLAKAILSELDVLLQSFEAEPGFLRLLSTPSLSKQERCQILDDSFRGKVQPYVLNFLKILTEKGYIRHFSACVDAYRAQYHQDNGILPVTVISAIALSADQEKRLTEKLASLTGKTVELHSRIDPDCMGGIRLRYDGKQLDDTVSHRLAAVSGLLKNTVL